MSNWPGYLLYEACFWGSYTYYTFGHSLRTEGWRHVPRTGPCLLVANHQSFLDPVAIGLAARRHIHYLARKTLFRGLFGKFLQTVNCVPVDLEGTATDALRKALTLLEEGEVVLVFPEGTRTRTGEMQPLRPGVHLLMRRGKAPILPVGVAGTFQAFSRDMKFPRFAPLIGPANGAGVAVSIGAPLDVLGFDELSREQSLQLLDRKMHKVQDRAEVMRRK